MVSMGSRMFSSPLLSSLHPRCNRSRRARIFDVEYSDSGPSPSRSTFDRDLTEQLQKLNAHHGNSCSSSKSLVNLSWICQALDVVICTQESVKQALHIQRTLPELTMVQHCMEDSVRMLDACLLLKDTLAGAHAHVKATHLALRRLKGLKLANQGDIQRAKQALRSLKRLTQKGIQRDGQSKPCTGSTKRLQACISMLRRMGNKLPIPSTVMQCPSLHFEDLKSTYSSMAAVYGGEISTLFFLRLLSMALSSVAGPRRSSSSTMAVSLPLHLSGKTAWGPTLLALQTRLETELLQITAQRSKTQRCGGILLPEICTLDTYLQQISEALPDISCETQARQDVRDLVNSASLLVEHVQSSMARLCCQLDCIAANLVDIRMVLLDSTPCSITAEAGNHI